jgi:hypothetical protein
LWNDAFSLHMRLGVDKSREAQRFPLEAYARELRRIKKLFNVSTVFVCSDRAGATARLADALKGEFEILTSRGIDALNPMHSVLADVAMLGETDHLVFTFSSNFGQAAFFLAAMGQAHRPSYVAMDDVFEGFRYYGFQLRLRHGDDGFNEIDVRDCAEEGQCEDMSKAMVGGDRRVFGLRVRNDNDVQ